MPETLNWVQNEGREQWSCERKEDVVFGREEDYELLE